ncbi:MAG: TIGR03013 family XrtA/PEP-CTERM system glycosyltransferase [Burkholderiaceae bacterium]
MFKLFNHYLPIRTALLAALEAVVLFQSVILGFRIRLPGEGLAAPYIEAAFFTVIMLISMSGLGLYQSHAERFRVTLIRLVLACTVSLLLSIALFYLVPGTYLGRGVMAFTSVFALAGLMLVRLLFTKVTDIGLPKRRVLVLGNGTDADQVIKFLGTGHAGRNVEFAGLYPVGQAGRAPSANSPDPGAPNPTNPEPPAESLMAALERLNVSEVVIATRERRGGVLPLAQLLEARLQGFRVMDLPSFYEREAGVLTIESMRASWMIFGGGFDQSLGRDLVKRVFDLLVSLALLIISLPVLVLAALAIVIESGTPIFYSQIRVGQGGKTFRITKLRSMRQDAEADGQPRWATVNDQRITRVGDLLRKTRIDELPQLWSVLKGDMSFVGPRPERPEFVKTLSEQIPFYDARHSLKPGVTGWAQVRYWYGGSVEDSTRKLEFDLYYVKNHSFFLDLLILIETIQVVLLGKGAR